MKDSKDYKASDVANALRDLIHFTNFFKIKDVVWECDQVEIYGTDKIAVFDLKTGNSSFSVTVTKKTL